MSEQKAEWSGVSDTKAVALLNLHLLIMVKFYQLALCSILTLKYMQVVFGEMTQNGVLIYKYMQFVSSSVNPI